MNGCALGPPWTAKGGNVRAETQFRSHRTSNARQDRPPACDPSHTTGEFSNPAMDHDALDFEDCISTLECTVMVFGALAHLTKRIVIVIAVMAALSASVVAQTDLNAILKASHDFRARGNYAAALVEAQRLEQAVKARFGVNHPN